MYYVRKLYLIKVISLYLPKNMGPLTNNWLSNGGCNRNLTNCKLMIHAHEYELDVQICHRQQRQLNAFKNTRSISFAPHNSSRSKFVH